MTNQPTAEEIVGLLAAVPPEQVIRSGFVGGRPWAKCSLCLDNEFHTADCPYWLAAAFVARARRAAEIASR